MKTPRRTLIRASALQITALVTLISASTVSLMMATAAVRNRAEATRSDNDLIGQSGAVTEGSTWSFTGSLSTPRSYHTATLLSSGKVLVAGGFNENCGENCGELSSAELYDPATGLWSPTGGLATPRFRHTATLLPSGKVLVVGGYNRGNGSLSSAELYDPASGTWSATGSLYAGLDSHTATLLPSGKVLVAGGSSNSELYDPANGLWTRHGFLVNPRASHTATLLPSGKVLVAGGSWGGSYLNSAELYDPATGNWNATGSLATAREQHTATLLPSGKVLVAGGNAQGLSLSSAELYDPASGLWSATGSLATARTVHTATLLPSGNVLVAGGFNGNALSSAELYDPASGLWSDTDSLAVARELHTATLLPSGDVLVAGGQNSSTGALNSAERYGPVPTESISGNISYCPNSGHPVRNVLLNLTGTTSGTTLSDSAGNYLLFALVSGGSYTVMPTKGAVAPASAGITAADVIATQRHFLGISPLTGCRLTAADVNGDGLVNNVDVTAIRRFALGLSSGIANVGKYKFSPSSRSYSTITSDQANQNYDTVVLGDVASPFVE